MWGNTWMKSEAELPRVKNRTEPDVSDTEIHRERERCFCPRRPETGPQVRPHLRFTAETQQNQNLGRTLSDSHLRPVHRIRCSGQTSWVLKEQRESSSSSCRLSTGSFIYLSSGLQIGPNKTLTNVIVIFGEFRADRGNVFCPVLKHYSHFWVLMQTENGHFESFYEI